MLNEEIKGSSFPGLPFWVLDFRCLFFLESSFQLKPAAKVGQSVVHEIISEQLLIRDIAFNSHVEIIDEIEVNMLYHRSLPFTRCL